MLHRPYLHRIACAALIAMAAMSADAGISATEQRLLDAIDATRTLADMRRIAASADGIAQGVGEGSVVAGSAEETALAEDLAARLRETGLAVRIEEFPVRSYRYEVPVLTANGARIAAIALHATGAVHGVRDGVAFRHGNEAGGRRLRVPLLDAGAGYAADYARLGDVRGKAVLVRRELRDWPSAQLTEAAMHGAGAALFYDHPSGSEHLDALRQDSLWGREQLPAVAISIRSARALQRQLEQGAVEITLEGAVEAGDGHSRNVLGILEGTEHPEQWVVVSGHFDRWFQGALDNVSGTAAVLDMARAFTAAKIRPRRSVLFLAVGSEEAGLEDPERDWLAGSYAFLQAHPEIFRNAALVFNVDGIGWAPSSALLSTTPDQLSLQKRVLDDLGLAGQVELKPLTGSAIDAWNYGVLGGAATNALISWDATYTPLYHTQEDVVQPEHFANLERDLRLLALALGRAATVEHLSPSLTGLADFLAARIDEDAAALPGVSFAETRAALAQFRAAAGKVEARPSASADRALLAVRHTLVPWLYAANGDYAQGLRTQEYARRAVAFDAALAALRAGDRTAALKALDALYEGRQCQRLSAAAYVRERSFWAGEGGWSSRFGHRAPPPLPAFDVACRALVAGSLAEVPAGIEAARAEAELAAVQALALMDAKLQAAADRLEEYTRTNGN